MKRIIRILVLVVIVAAVAAGGYWLYQTRFAPAPTAAQTFTQIVPVRQGTLSNSISVVGELDAETSQDLAFQSIDGTANLMTLTVAAGNVVKKGQVLATIDKTLYQQALDQAKSDLQAAEKALAELKTPATALQVSQADLAIAQANYAIQAAQSALEDLEHPDLAALQQAVDDAKIALAKAQSDLVSKQSDETADQDLYDLQVAEATPVAEYNRLASETYSDEFYQDRLRVAFNKMMDAQDARVTFEIQAQADLLAAQTAVRKAQQSIVDAQKALANAQTGSNAFEIKKAQLAVDKAKVDLAQAQSDRAALDAGADPADLAAAQADVDKKRLAVTDAETALANTELKAPFDGTVLETNVRVGDELTNNTVILTVADLTNLQILASVDETTIRRVKKGQTAQVSFDAFPGQIFKSTVLSVPLQGELQNDVMVYQVPLSLEGLADLPARVGMTANVNIETEQASNALIVPTIALQRVRGQYQVMLANPNDSTAAPVATPVEVGLSDGTFTQIVQGLKEGDQVVMTLTAANQNGNSPFGGGNFRGGFGAFPGGGIRVPDGGPRPSGGGNTRP